ncbi:MAG: hypothetical protein ACXVLQ_09650 [Bacteriovorax sp.]
MKKISLLSSVVFLGLGLFSTSSLATYYFPHESGVCSVVSQNGFDPKPYQPDEYHVYNDLSSTVANSSHAPNPGYLFFSLIVNHKRPSSLDEYVTIAKAKFINKEIKQDLDVGIQNTIESFSGSELNVEIYRAKILDFSKNPPWLLGFKDSHMAIVHYVSPEDTTKYLNLRCELNFQNR